MATEEAPKDNGVGPITASGTFFQGDIDAGLERVRLRLIDLTPRNRLLNFRFTRKSTIRVVDELPDQLFEMLMNERELAFKPVPKPSRVELFRLAEEKKATGDSGGTGLGDSQLALPPPDQWARRLGIQTSYELPDATTSDADHPGHVDLAIQTLHYPEQLEAMLSTIASAARSAIEETGSNMLYLSFGFLEWYESDESSEARLAPLLLVPASLRKGQPDPKTNAYQYFVSYSGEDLSANISLQEKMRRDWNLLIPDLDDDPTPEHYFHTVAPILKQRPHWRIRREVAISMLSFGKLLMYRDLDPDKWPRTRELRNHSRIREFFLGREVEGSDFAEEYEIDSDPKKTPRLIEDADSSQHSAIIDALSGRSLVIQGPPGTGKSQTITNLIAAAIERGKTVLFVSEKLAALEVVRARLNRAALGHLCLELHSHKTRKKELLSDIEVRLSQRATFGDARELGDLERTVAADRDRLNRYAALINRQAGNLGHTIHEILWRARMLRRRLGDQARTLADIDAPSAALITREEYDQEQLRVAALAQSFDDVLKDGSSLHAHTWAGVQNAALSFLDLPRVRDSLEAVTGALNNLIDLVSAHCSIDDSESLRTSLARLPTWPTGGLVDSLHHLLSRETRARIGNALGFVRRHGQLCETLRSDIGPVEPFLAADWRQVTELIASTQLAPGAQNLADVTKVVARLESAAVILRAAGEGINNHCERFTADLDATPEVADLVASVLESLANLPVAALLLRHDALLEPTTQHLALEGCRAGGAIVRRRAELSARYDLAFLPPSRDLRVAAAQLSEAGFLWFLNSRARGARRLLRGLLRNPSGFSNRSATRELRLLADYQDDETRFLGDQRYQDALGRAYRGIATQFADVQSLVEWWRQLSSKATNRVGHSIVHAAWKADPDALTHLQMRDRSVGLAEVLRAAGRSATSLDTLGIPSSSRTVPIATLVTALDARASVLSECISSLRSLGLGDGLSFERVLAAGPSLREVNAIRDQVRQDDGLIGILGIQYARADANWESVAATLEFADKVHSTGLMDDVLEKILSNDVAAELARLQTLHSALMPALDRVARAWEAWSGLAALDEKVWCGSDDGYTTLPLGVLRDRAKRALASDADLQSWTNLLRAERALSHEASANLGLQVRAGRIRHTAILTAFEFVVFESMARAVLRDNQDLMQFRGDDHERVRVRFRDNDRRVMELHRRRVALVADQRPVPSGNGMGPVRTHTELRLLEREVNKQRKHVPIRQLMSRAGRALQALKPCFMMGPLSVAQYLEPGKLTFDLVIMDEASQLKPEDALGAVARGSQLVVVGDSMQLPPTSFFERIGEEEVEDETAEGLTTAESILDVAGALYHPKRPLRWHYRSRHGSLVAFSNREFYGGRLIVFPSPAMGGSEYGVKLHHISEGVFENRKNAREAAAIVKAAIEHMRRRPHESLGIVALNLEQSRLIEGELEQLAKGDPFAARFLDPQEQVEPFFVKNLENVQGDERDVMFISVTYGASPSGQVFQRFGPISGPNGHRRLNVLFTRARKRVEVFSSLAPEDVRVEPTSSWGVRALKGYLSFCQTGHLEQPEFTTREPDSPFELEVAEALAGHGFRTTAQLGVAGYFIDLAVEHPKKPGTHILAIECDGATYHSAKSARDRDRLRQSVLESLGWRVHRIWSTDWFKEPDRELGRAVARIQEALDLEAARLAVQDTSVTYGDVDTSRPRANAASVSLEDLRETLLDFRSRVVDSAFADLPSGSSILRDEMIIALLRERPTDRNQWLRKIPISLRIDTAPEHMVFLDDILAMISEGESRHS